MDGRRARLRASALRAARPAPQLAGFFARECAGGLDSFIAEMRALPRADSRRAAQELVPAQGPGAPRLLDHLLTNFEHHIEEALQDAGKEAVALARTSMTSAVPGAGACHVIKFHWRSRWPETVVLTESQYFSRLRLEAAPDQRLGADLLSNSFPSSATASATSTSGTSGTAWSRCASRAARRSRSARRTAAATGRPSAPGSSSRAARGTGIDVIELDPNDKTKSVVDLLDSLGG